MFTILIASGLLAAAPERPLAIHADKARLADGKVLEDAWVVIEDGKISSVRSGGEAPEDSAVLRHTGWISSGLVALHAYAGTPRAELRDTTRTMLPEARIAWALDPARPEVADCLREGITSLLVTPARQSLVGGAGAVLKTAGGTIVSREAQLSLGFAAMSYVSNRYPTSFQAGLAELERLLEKPSGLLEKAKEGELPVLFEVSERSDVMRALAFAKQQELRGALSGAEWTGELAKSVKESGLSVVLPPIGLGEERRALRAVLSLAQEGVPFGFGLDAPLSHPASLRLAAALCVREGLAADQAWRALSSEAARIAGVEAQLGALAEGQQADVVLWSGDPLELTSSVQAVYVDGRRAYTAEGR